MYDVVIIGAGISGCATARELSRYKLNTCVIDRASDVCEGTSKANSGIVHAGFSSTVGSLMAKLNVEGNAMIEELSKDLDFHFKRNGSLVVSMKEEDKPKLVELYETGVKNGVPGLQLLSQEELRYKEPNISDEAIGALFAPTGGIVCPFNMTIAMAENANVNGVEFKLNTEVKEIKKINTGYELCTNEGKIESKIVINAAGVYGDKFHNMVSESKIHITARRGEYVLLDREVGNHVDSTIFLLPGKLGKGVLVTPTVHGNLLVGPTASDTDDKEAVCTTREGLDSVTQKAEVIVKGIPFHKIITSFSGLRAHEDNHDFIIKEVEDAKGFIDVVGIESPGLSSAPAIGKMVAGIVVEILKPKINTEFLGVRQGLLHPKNLSFAERVELIKRKPEYGNVICRCETVTEGEILDAIHRPIGAKTLNAIKRRTRTGMGRCQAGFCTPKTIEILKRELGKDIFEIAIADIGTEIVVGYDKDSL